MATEVFQDTLAAPGGHHPSAPDPLSALADSRYRNLVGEAAWASLPEPIRRRFSKRIPADSAMLYEGEVVATQISIVGRLLAQLARIIGAPLPLDDRATGPSVVSVTEAQDGKAQTWLRTYARPGGLPQVVRSMKCFRGPTGLEERVGGGVGMALAVSVRDGALHFTSTHFFIDIGSARVRLPHIASPGTLTVVHREEGGGTFSFRLTLEHAILGRLIHQLACFREGVSIPAAELAGRTRSCRVT
jgi:hypothetical protein